MGTAQTAHIHAMWANTPTHKINKSKTKEKVLPSLLVVVALRITPALQACVARVAEQFLSHARTAGLEHPLSARVPSSVTVPQLEENQAPPLRLFTVNQSLFCTCGASTSRHSRQRYILQVSVTALCNFTHFVLACSVFFFSF